MSRYRRCRSGGGPERCGITVSVAIFVYRWWVAPILRSVRVERLPPGLISTDGRFSMVHPLSWHRRSGIYTAIVVVAASASYDGHSEATRSSGSMLLALHGIAIMGRVGEAS